MTKEDVLKIIDKALSYDLEKEWASDKSEP